MERKFPCSYPSCSYEGKTKSSQKDHEKRIHRQSTVEIKGYEDPIKRDIEGQFKCPRCEELFKHPGRLQDHMRLRHPVNKEGKLNDLIAFTDTIELSQDRGTDLLKYLSMTYNATYQVLICVQCGIGLHHTADALREHVLTFRHTTPPKLSVVAQLIQGLDLAHWTSVRRPQNGTRVPSLKLYDGRQCTICGYCCIASKTMSRHHHEIHGSGSANNFSLATVQRWDGGRRSQCWLVCNSGDDAERERVAAEQGVTKAKFKKWYDEFKDVTAADVTDGKQKDTPWLQLTRWAMHFEGVNLKNITKLLDRVVTPRADVLEVCLFHFWTEAETTVGQADGLVKRIINTSRGFADSTGLLAIDQFDTTHILHETSRRYRLYVNSFVRYLVDYEDAIEAGTADQHPCHHLMKFTSGQKKVLGAIRKIRDDRREGEEKKDKRMLPALSSFFGQVFCQMVGGEPFDAIFIHWLAILGIDRTNAVFHKPSAYTPILAGVSQSYRLAVAYIHLCNKETGGDHEKQVAAAYKCQKTWLNDSCRGPLYTLIQQKRYGRVVASRMGRDQNTIWDIANVDCVWYCNEPLSVKTFVKIIQEAIPEAIVLLENCLLNKSGLVEATAAEIKSIDDNLAESLVGYNFTRHPNTEKKLKPQILPAIERFLGLERNIEKGYVQGGNITKKGLDWLEARDQELLEMMFFIGHTTGGMPGRMSELRLLLSENTATRMRGVYFHQSCFWRTGYNKTQSVTGLEKHIVRGLPNVAGALYYLRQGIVFPMLCFFRRELKRKEKGLLPFVFASPAADDPWPASRLSAILRRQFARTGLNIGAEAYRQIVTAIDNRFVRPGDRASEYDQLCDYEDEMDDASYIGDLQQGHSALTHRLHYARQFQGNYGVHADLLVGFLDRSRVHQEFFLKGTRWIEERKIVSEKSALIKIVDMLKDPKSPLANHSITLIPTTASGGGITVHLSQLSSLSEIQDVHRRQADVDKANKDKTEDEEFLEQCDTEPGDKPPDPLLQQHAERLEERLSAIIPPFARTPSPELGDDSIGTTNDDNFPNELGSPNTHSHKPAEKLRDLGGNVSGSIAHSFHDEFRRVSGDNWQHNPGPSEKLDDPVDNSFTKVKFSTSRTPTPELMDDVPWSEVSWATPDVSPVRGHSSSVYKSSAISPGVPHTKLVSQSNSTPQKSLCNDILRHPNVHPFATRAASVIAQLYPTVAGKKSKFRTPEQHMCTALVAKNTTDLLVILPTGAGKTVIWNVASQIDASGNDIDSVDLGITIVVIPLKRLLEETARKLSAQKTIRYHVWEEGHFPTNNASIVLTTPERMQGIQFKKFMDAIVTRNRLNPLVRIVWDEAHLYLTDVDYRPALINVRDTVKFGCPQLFLTATLPPTMQPQLERFFNSPSLPVVRTATVRRDIFFEAPIIVDNDYERTCYLRELLMSLNETNEERTQRGEPKHRMLIYTTKISDCNDIANELGLPRNYSDWAHGEADFWFYAYEDDPTAGGTKPNKQPHSRGAGLVATKTISHGVNIPKLSLLVFSGIPGRMTEFAQVAGRVGRDGTKGTVKIVLTKDQETKLIKDIASYEADRKANSMRLTDTTGPIILALGEKGKLSKNGPNHWHCMRKVQSACLDGPQHALSCKEVANCTICGRCGPTPPAFFHVADTHHVEPIEVTTDISNAINQRTRDEYLQARAVAEIEKEIVMNVLKQFSENPETYCPLCYVWVDDLTKHDWTSKCKEAKSRWRSSNGQAVVNTFCATMGQYRLVNKHHCFNCLTPLALCPSRVLTSEKRRQGVAKEELKCKFDNSIVMAVALAYSETPEGREHLDTYSDIKYGESFVLGNSLRPYMLAQFLSSGTYWQNYMVTHAFRMFAEFVVSKEHAQIYLKAQERKVEDWLRPPKSGR